jgi:hypothetical protein
MVNCYIHTDRKATGSCVICGRGICRECSNWAAGDIYLCPKCWQENTPVQPVSEKRKTRVVAGGLFGGGLSRALYYAVAVVIVVIGSWYVYATFIAPIISNPILSSGGAPVVPVSAPSTFGLGHYKLLIEVSVGMFMVVLIGGELILRTAPKQPRAAVTQPKAQPPTQPVRPAAIPAVEEVNFGSKKDVKQSQAVTLQPEPQALTQTVRTGQKRTQPALTHPELKPLTQTKLVYCIYCGNKIPSAAVFCDKCGKGQQ